MKTTDTPRTDACPHCGKWHDPYMSCVTKYSEIISDLRANYTAMTERARKAEAEVERLTGRMKETEDLIKGLHDGWKKARKAHLETCKNAQAEIDKLHTENVCLQELIQEFYEWTKRDYPTESEVREIMDRYYNLLNK